MFGRSLFHRIGAQRECRAVAQAITVAASKRTRGSSRRFPSKAPEWRAPRRGLIMSCKHTTSRRRKRRRRPRTRIQHHQKGVVRNHVGVVGLPVLPPHRRQSLLVLHKQPGPVCPVAARPCTHVHQSPLASTTLVSKRYAFLHKHAAHRLEYVNVPTSWLPMEVMMGMRCPSTVFMCLCHVASHSSHLR